MLKKILIVEDHPTVQNITSKLLQAQNYEVKTAQDGVQGLEILEDNDFDMILLDIDIPKMDGIEYTKKIRTMSNPVKAQIPIIAITGNTSNYTSSDFAAIGINDYMQKPINFNTLISKLDDFFKK